jgi:hypothetical protein
VADETYEEMTVEELKDELADRELPLSGNKAELIARLEAADAGEAGEPRAEGEEPPPEPTVDTVIVQDAQGNDVEVEAGMDGANPVSPENPPEEAVVYEPPPALGEGEFANLAPEGVDTVEVTTADGTTVLVESGVDGENPVSPNNPPDESTIGNYNESPFALAPPSGEEPEPPPPPEEPEEVPAGSTTMVNASNQAVVVPMGMDGENPASAENPPEGAVLYDPANPEETYRTEAREDQKAGAKG